MRRYEAHLLMGCREALEEIRDITEEIREMEGGMLHAQRMDGMPRAGHAQDGMTMRLVRLEQKQKRLQSARAAYARYSERAQTILLEMMEPARLFYTAYCLLGKPFEEAWHESGVSRETCKKYAREVGG
ncbi:MAG: hypothetical protein PUI99_11140 [Clostridiales bacterium]|nr:hypothetical protein [Clostridiales bacterium]